MEEPATASQITYVLQRQSTSNHSAKALPIFDNWELEQIWMFGFVPIQKKMPSSFTRWIMCLSMRFYVCCPHENRQLKRSNYCSNKKTIQWKNQKCTLVHSHTKRSLTALNAGTHHQMDTSNHFGECSTQNKSLDRQRLPKRCQAPMHSLLPITGLLK